MEWIRQSEKSICTTYSVVLVESSASSFLLLSVQLLSAVPHPIQHCPYGEITCCSHSLDNGKCVKNISVDITDAIPYQQS